MGTVFSATMVITAVTALISILAFSRQQLFNKLLFSPYVVKGRNEWYRVFSHALVHADYMHLLVNMFVFYQFGLMLEWELAAVFGPTLGVIYYLLLYLGGAAFASLPAFKKHTHNPGYNAVGASGAVSAILFAYIVVNPLHGLGLLFLPGMHIPAFLFGILYLAYEAYMDKRGRDNVAHDAHFWGALFGVGLIIILRYEYLLEFIAQISYYISSKLS